MPQAPPDIPTSPHLSDPTAVAAAEAIRARVPRADPLRYLPDVHPLRIPRHIAVIMDGNGRWAKARGFDRTFGHRNGARVVRETLEECVRVGVEVLTLYSFSQENWKRPADEVAALMMLCETYLAGERDHMVREGIRFRMIGDREGLPASVREAIEQTERATARSDGTMLVLALNYGSRSEITRAARTLAERVQAGTLRPDQITPELLDSALDTAGMPDPDLLIRTAGEMRVSNYLLWQISYAEFHVTQTLWPDFGPSDLHAAIRDYAGRNRKFGGL
jgi:undecaprenyl diphosphate synthase